MSNKRKVSFLKAVRELSGKCEDDDDAYEELGKILLRMSNKKQGQVPEGKQGEVVGNAQKTQSKSSKKNKHDSRHGHDENQGTRIAVPSQGPRQHSRSREHDIDNSFYDELGIRDHFTWNDGLVWWHLQKDESSPLVRWKRWNTWDNGCIVRNSSQYVSQAEALDLLTFVSNNKATPLRFGDKKVGIASQTVTDIIYKKHKEKTRSTVPENATIGAEHDQGEQEGIGEETDADTEEAEGGEEEGAAGEQEDSNAAGPGDAETETTGGGGESIPGDQPEPEGKSDRDAAGDSPGTTTESEKEEEEQDVSDDNDS